MIFTEKKPERMWTLLLLCVWAVIILFVILKQNPKLLDFHHPLMAKIAAQKNNGVMTVPNPSHPASNINEQPDSLFIADVQRRGFQNQSLQIYRRYFRQSFLSLPDVQKYKNGFWWPTEDGQLFVDKKASSLFAVTDHGQLDWTFSVGKNKITTQPWVTKDVVFIGTDIGRIYALRRADGHLLWFLPTHTRIQLVFAMGPHVYAAAQNSEDAFFVFELNGQTGQILKRSTTFAGSVVGFTLDESSHQILLSTHQGIVYDFDQNLSRRWSYKTAGALNAPVTVAAGKVFIANEAAQAIALNLQNAEKIWEYKLSSPAYSSVTYLPEHDLVAILTNNGYLHAIEASSGKGRWKFNTHNESPNQQVTVFRLNNHAIIANKLIWKYKGWVLWAPCSNDRFCVYRPGKGQLIGRIYTRAKILSRPYYKNGHIYVLLGQAQPTPYSRETPPSWGVAQFQEVKPKDVKPKAAP